MIRLFFATHAMIVCSRGQERRSGSMVCDFISFSTPRESRRVWCAYLSWSDRSSSSPPPSRRTPSIPSTPSLLLQSPSRHHVLERLLHHLPHRRPHHDPALPSVKPPFQISQTLNRRKSAQRSVGGWPTRATASHRGPVRILFPFSPSLPWLLLSGTERFCTRGTVGFLLVPSAGPLEGRLAIVARCPLPAGLSSRSFGTGRKSRETRILSCSVHERSTPHVLTSY